MWGWGTCKESLEENMLVAYLVVNQVVVSSKLSQLGSKVQWVPNSK